jgi:hypothetical protein
MLRRVAFLSMFLAAASFGFAQSQSNDQSSSQPKPADGQAQSSTPANSQAKPQANDPSVFVLKGPERPPDQPQFTPELRAVDLEKRPALSASTKVRLIQLMQAEFAHVRHYFPLGDKAMAIDPQGRVTPNDAVLFQEVQQKGVAAKAGEKVQITNLVIREKSIYLELNGGPKKKTKWYQHISVGVGGSGGSTTPINGDEKQATGAAFTLQFNKHVPEMNNEELKKLLSPVLDFSAKSAAEVFTETLPPKVRDAIKKHEVLVGMNHEMVVMAIDRPRQKMREKDESGKEYEEWMYGTPPKDVTFIRFVGDEVTQVKIMKPGSPAVLKTEKEVDVKDGVVSLAALKASNSPDDASQQQEEQQPNKRPTLRKEGETMPNDPEVLRAPNGQTTAPQPPHPRDEPEWGQGKQPPPPAPQPPPPAPSEQKQAPPAQPTPTPNDQKPPQ